MKKPRLAYLVAALSLFSSYQALEHQVAAQELETTSAVETTVAPIVETSAEVVESTQAPATTNVETTATETTAEVLEETTVTTIEETTQINVEEKATSMENKVVTASTTSTPKSGYAASNIILKDLNGNNISGQLPKGKKITGVEKDGWIIIDFNGQKAKFLKSFLSQSPISFQGFATANTQIRANVTNTPLGRNLNLGGFIAGKYHDNGEYIEFTNYGKKAFVPVSSVLQLDKNTNGWVTKGNYKYFVEKLNDKQEVARGWKVINGSTYYFDPMMRYMYTGVKSTGENVYYFGTDGKVSSGYKVIPGTNHSGKVTFGAPTQAEIKSNVSTRAESSFLGQAATNEALKAIGRKYYWYGTDISGTSNSNGLYCSGLVYRAYKNMGITIPGPEWGNEATARKKGAQSGPTYRGWGPAGTYGYQMVVHQYTDTHTKTGGKRFKNYVNNLQPGDIIFARDPYMTYLPASHSAIYAGKVKGNPFIIHSGFAGTHLESYYNIRNNWGYHYMPYAQRPYADSPTPQIGGSTPSTGTYTVQKGDYLYKIASQHGITVDQLKKWNNLTNNYIYTGNKLIVSDPSKTATKPAPVPTPKPAPAPTPTPKPAPTTTAKTYTVQKGDYLYKIAKQYGVTVSQLKTWNKLTNNYIYTGNKLIVSDPSKTATKPAPAPAPTPTPKPAPTPTAKTYTVQKGDYLYKIAKQYGVTVSQLKTWNKLTNNYIYTGNKLIVSDPSKTATKPAPVPTPKPAPAPSTRKTYTVKKGDYLYKIAKTYGVTVQQLKTWNKLTNNYIYSGDKLIVSK